MCVVEGAMNNMMRMNEHVGPASMIRLNLCHFHLDGEPQYSHWCTRFAECFLLSPNAADPSLTTGPRLQVSAHR